MKKIVFGILLIVMPMLSGCGMKETYNLKNCEYEYQSITNLTISGHDVSKGVSPLMLPVIVSILTGNATTIPLRFTLNVDVTNPNSGAASFESMLYIISIDEIKITDGKITEPFRVEAGQSKILPVNIDVDVIDLNKLNTRPVTERAILNFLGLSDTPSKVHLQLKPSFKVAKQTFSTPGYISVNFTFGGKTTQ